MCFLSNIYCIINSKEYLENFLYLFLIELFKKEAKITLDIYLNG